MADLRILVLGCLAFVAVGAEICVKRGELTTACLFSPNCEPTKNATLIKPLLEELSRLSTGSKRFLEMVPELVRCKSTLQFKDYSGCDSKMEDRMGCWKACRWMKGILNGVQPYQIWQMLGMNSWSSGLNIGVNEDYLG